MTGYSETTSHGTVTELQKELARKPQRYRNPELVFRVVAQLGPMTASELDAKLDLSVAEIDRAIRDHPGLLDVSEGPGEAIWDLAPGICRQCLCVESDACVDEETGETCDWANDERTLCTFCADGGDRQDDGDDVVDELVTGQDLALEDDIPRQNDEETGGPGTATVPPDPADVSDQLDAERRAAEAAAGDDAGEDLVQDEHDVDEDLVDDEELTARQRDILEALEDLVVVHDQLEEELQEAKAREQELEHDLTDAWGRVDHLEMLLTARAQQEAPTATRPLVIAFLAFAIVVAVWVLGLWMGGAA